MPDKRDVVVVGAGLAGLAAALELNGSDFVVLESTDRVGGRLKSESRGEYWLNYGAHVFGDSSSYVGELIDHVGLEALPAHGPVTALAFNGRILANGKPETYPFLLPLRLRDRIALINIGLRIRRESRSYLREIGQRDGEDHWAPSRRGQLFLNDRTFSDFLGQLSPDLSSIFTTISNRAGAPPEEISAGHGVAAFAMTLSKHPVLSRSIVGGSSLLPEALAHRVSDRIRLNTAVTAIVPTKSGVEVRSENGDGTNVIVAKSAIVTTPAYITHRLLPELPPATRDALKAIKYGPSVVMAILTSESGPMPWDDLYALTVPDSSFNMLFNIAHVLRRRGVERKPGGSLMIYGTGEPGRRLADKTDDEVRARFLRDLQRLFPETEGIVEETKIHRWSAAGPYTFPGRGQLQGALEQTLDPVYLAGDYLGTAFTETSVLSAKEAARRALARL